MGIKSYSTHCLASLVHVISALRLQKQSTNAVHIAYFFFSNKISSKLHLILFFILEISNVPISYSTVSSISSTFNGFLVTGVDSDGRRIV